MTPRHPMTLYRGERLIGPGMTAVGVRVTRFDGVTGYPLTPRYSRVLRDHSDRFEWGYMGSGPAQLALALLLDATADPPLSVALYHAFKHDVVKDWVGDRWHFTAGMIQEWVAAQLRIAAERERMRDPGYTPTIAEALADPEGFVAGMTEVAIRQDDPHPPGGPKGGGS